MEIRAEEISQIIKEQIKDYDKKVELSETGTILSVGDGIARVYGLEKAMTLELVEFPGGILGLVLNLEEDNVGVAIMGDDTQLKEGDQVKLDAEAGLIVIGEKTFSFPKLPPEILAIRDAGGLLPYTIAALEGK